MGACDSSEKEVVPLFYYNSENKDQKDYCTDFISCFKYKKSTPYKCCSSTQMDFSIKVNIKGKTTTLLNTFDPSESRRNEVYEKLKALLDEHYGAK